MKTILSMACVLCLFFAGGAVALSQENSDELVDVKARDIQLQVPMSWKQGEVTSDMRAAQFEIPGKDGESAELVVYYFGGPTGGVRANIDRWIDQFDSQEREFDLVSGQCRDGSYILADISGTYNKPIGPPRAGRTVETPGSRVIGIILVTKKDGEEDYYFLKLSGKDELVKSQAKALRKAIGAKAESEKPMKLEDADNRP